MAARFKLNKEDGLKILKGAGIALGGALITYIAQIIPETDFGPYSELIVALSSVLVNIGYKYFKNDV